MKVSRKVQYGIRAILELAMNYGKGVVPVSDIAKAQGISVKYLEHIMAPLRKGGIVMANRGIAGGYALKRPPWEIKIWEVLEALEEQAEPVACLDNSAQCERIRTCKARPLWAGLSRHIRGALDRVTLQDILDKGETLELST